MTAQVEEQRFTSATLGYQWLQWSLKPSLLLKNLLLENKFKTRIEAVSFLHDLLIVKQSQMDYRATEKLNVD